MSHITSTPVTTHTAKNTDINAMEPRGLFDADKFQRRCGHRRLVRDLGLSLNTKYSLFKMSYELLKKCSDDARHAACKFRLRNAGRFGKESEAKVEHDVAGVKSMRRRSMHMSSVSMRR